MFKRMKLSVKLISGFVAVAAIAAVIGAVGFVSLRGAKAHIVDVGTERLPSIENLLVISGNLEKLKVAQRTLLNAGTGAADQERAGETGDGKPLIEEGVSPKGFWEPFLRRQQ